MFVVISRFAKCFPEIVVIYVHFSAMNSLKKLVPNELCVKVMKQKYVRYCDMLTWSRMFFYFHFSLPQPIVRLVTCYAFNFGISSLLEDLLEFCLLLVDHVKK